MLEHGYGYGYEIIPVTRWGWGWDKSLIPVGFGYGDGDEFFLWGWVWDSETRPRPAPLPSLGVSSSGWAEVSTTSASIRWIRPGYIYSDESSRVLVYCLESHNMLSWYVCRNRDRDGTMNKKRKRVWKEIWSRHHSYSRKLWKTIKIRQVCGKLDFGSGNRLRVGKVLAPYSARPRAVPLIKNAKSMWFLKC